MQVISIENIRKQIRMMPDATPCICRETPGKTHEKALKSIQKH
jgi:hypothetical protein